MEYSRSQALDADAGDPKEEVKMGNIEKIRHEIEFLKELNEGLYTEGDNSYYEGHDNACNHILTFIDSMPEEPLIPPNSMGLEEEINNYFRGLWPGTETAEQCNTDLHFTPPAIMRLARHFAEWGAECKESLQAQKICKENDDNLPRFYGD